MRAGTLRLHWLLPIRSQNHDGDPGGLQVADRTVSLEAIPGNETSTEGGFEKETLDALDSVYRFALQLTKDPCDCDDLVQDTYLRAYRSRHQYRLGTNCTAWLFTICHNLWIQKRQREGRVTAWEESDLDEIASARRQENGAIEMSLRRVLELPEFDEALHRALAVLPEIYRTPVVIIDVEDQTYDSAAAILAVPIGTVRSRLFRGRRMLQDRLLVAYAEDAGLMSGRRRAQARPAS
jgi:RNA polymerase sigma-70 factor (ECF subfamily)